MPVVSRFQRANKIALEQAEKVECLAVFQTGPSLRKQDFSPWSDVDVLVVHADAPEQHWGQQLREINALGRRVFSIEGVTFPSLESLKNRLERRGYSLTSVSFAKFLGKRQCVMLSGREKESEKRKMFIFNMRTGDLEEGLVGTKNK